MQLVQQRNETGGGVESKRKPHGRRNELFCYFMPEIRENAERGTVKMTRDEISQYYYLGREAERADELLGELRRKMHGVTESERKFLSIQEQKLIQKKERSLMMREEICDYVDNVEDCLTRLILFERYIKGSSWTAVAHTVGGGNTPDSVRKIAERHLAKDSK